MKGEAAIDVKDLEAKKPKSSGVRRDGWMDGWMDGDLRSGKHTKSY